MRRKVFGIGLSKTGTTSLTSALNLLGYRAIHYPPLPELEQLLDTYDAATDTSVACSFEKLDALYPGSQFVLTVRDEASWMRSAEREFRGRSVHEPWKLHVRRVLYGAHEWDPDLFLDGYRKHNRRVQSYFAQRSDLLILNIIDGQGWPELCAFLELSVPDRTFPRENVAAPS